MRPLFLVVVPSLLAMASAAGLLAVAMHAKRQPDAFNYEDPKHPVTSEMLLKTAAMTAKPAPYFHVRDVAGKPMDIGGSARNGLEFVYFVQVDCPCSYAAEPLFESLRDRYAGKISFVGVTNASVPDCKKWIQEMQVNCPLVSDPDSKIMHEYKAVSSAYSALISRDGHIVKMWPGFSRGLLVDMNATLANALGEQEKPFDTQYAPEKPATGCRF